MGLDFSIHINFKNINTLEEQSVEIAYWRKFFELRSRIMELAKNSGTFLREEDDTFIETEIDFIEDIVTFLCNEIPDRQSEVFSDSIWGGACGRQIVIRELERLCLWDTIYSRLNDIRDANDMDYRTSFTFILSELGDIIEDIERDAEYKDSDINLVNILEKLEDYEITLQIFNSY